MRLSCLEPTGQGLALRLCPVGRCTGMGGASARCLPGERAMEAVRGRTNGCRWGQKSARSSGQLAIPGSGAGAAHEIHFIRSSRVDVSDPPRPPAPRPSASHRFSVRLGVEAPCSAVCLAAGGASVGC